jgi:DNA polymerase III subunit alpha
LLIRMNGAADAHRLKSLLAPFGPGSAPVRIQYQNAQAACEIVLGANMRVRLEDALITELQNWLKRENVEIVYQ